MVGLFPDGGQISRRKVSSEYKGTNNKSLHKYLRHVRERERNVVLNGILNNGSEERVKSFYYNYSRSVWNRFTLMFIHDEKEKLSLDMHFNL